MVELTPRIANVADGSLAQSAGLRKGDVLLAVNGASVCDILDYRFRIAEPLVVVEVLRDGKTIKKTISKPPEEDLGIAFEEELFDGTRKCVNDCIFCFLKQMPPGLRESLYVRDDDYRLSFAHGNYITLTNLTERDMQRICSHKLSPLYVSVHSTEKEIREFMLGNKKAGHIMSQLQRLAQAGIRIHTQVVVCPGVNDGEHLKRTVYDLASLYPSVQSVAVVPVGLTRFRKDVPLVRPVMRQDAVRVMEICEPLQNNFKRVMGTRFVFPSDEFYLLSGRHFPPARAYEGFPQLEDGVGVCRLFLDDLRRLEGRLTKCQADPRDRRQYVFVTGVLSSRLVEDLARILNIYTQLECRVCVVKNMFFGDSVTVTGLLTGKDIWSALKGNVSSDETVLIPSVALNEGRFLDDVTLKDLQGMLGVRVEDVEPLPRGVYRKIFSGKAC